ncbi:MAG: MFS transporter [Anaerolineaceae bacterium]
MTATRLAPDAAQKRMPSGQPPPSVPLLLALSSLGSVLAPLNSTMIAIALPDIRQEFALSHGAVAWLVSGYLIAMAVAQPIGGRLGDQIGRERVYRTGLIAFLIFSIASALAPNFLLLVVLRVAQAVSGAVLIPNGTAMLRTQAPAHKLGRLNGINGSVISLAAAAGPLLGAGVLELGSWRWMFPLSIPIVLLALVLLRRLRISEAARPPRMPIDWIGMALFVALLVAVTLQLGAIREGDGGVGVTTRWFVAIAVAVAFTWRQRVSSSPTAEWRLFRSRSFSGATAYVLLTNFAMYTTVLMIPFFIRDVQGKGALTAGLLLAAMSALFAITSPFGGRLSDARGRRPPAQLGTVMMTVGALTLLAGLQRDVSAIYLAGCMALMGVGLGLGTGAATVASAPPRLAGSAAGTSSMMRYIGSIVGAGILAGVLSNSSAGTAGVATFRVLAIAIACTAALGFVAATFIHRRAPSESAAVSNR